MKDYTQHSDDEAKVRLQDLASSSLEDECEIIDIPEVKKQIGIPDYSIPIFKTSSIPSDSDKQESSDYILLAGGACILSIGTLIVSTALFAYNTHESQDYNNCVISPANCTEMYPSFDAQRNDLFFYASLGVMGFSALSALMTVWGARKFYKDYKKAVKGEKKPFEKFASLNKITDSQEEYLTKQNEMLRKLGKTENQYIATQLAFRGIKVGRTNPDTELFISEVNDLAKSHHEEHYSKIADNISEGNPEFRSAALKNFSAAFNNISKKIDTILRGVILHFELVTKNLNPNDWADPIYNVAKELKGGGTPFNLCEDRHKEHNQQVIQKLIPLVEANRFTKRLDVLQESTKIPKDMVNSIAMYMTPSSVKREEIASFIERAKKVTFER